MTLIQVKAFALDQPDTKTSEPERPFDYDRMQMATIGRKGVKQ